MTSKDLGTDGPDAGPAAGAPTLLPCFYCGTPDPGQDPHYEYGFEGWSVWCGKCHSSVQTLTREATFAAWNALSRNTPPVADRQPALAGVAPESNQPE